MKQNFRRNVGFDRLADAPKDEIHLSLAQFPNLLRDHRYLCHVNGDLRISSAEPLIHRRKQASDNGFVAADSDFADSRISKEFKLLEPLSQIIKHSRAAVKQRVSILCRLDAPAAAI